MIKTALRAAALVAAVWSTSAHAYVERRWVARYDALGGGIGFAKQVLVDAGGSPRIVGTYGPNWPGDGLLAARYDGDGNLLWQVVLPGRSFGTEGVWSGGSRAASLDAEGVLSVPDTGGRLLRISADGVIVADLDLAGVIGTPVGAVATAAAPDGGILVAGNVASAAGPGDVAVAKLDATTLVPAWIQVLDRGGDDALARLVVGPRGEVFVAGMSDGALSIWSIDAAGLRRLDVTGPAMYVRGFDVDAAGGMAAVGGDQTGALTTVRYGADGALRWTATAPSRAATGGVRVAPDGSVYVAGLSSLNYDLMKYAPDGTFAWERMYGDGWGDSEIYDLVLDRGEPIVTGEFGYCSDRIRTMKHSAAGDLLWDAALLLPASSCSSLNYGYSIAVDGNGNVYVGGDSVDASAGGGWKPTLIKYAQIDLTPPVTAAAVAGTAGANDWYTSAVDVTLTASDPVADASGVREIRWSLDGGAETVVPGDAAALAVTTDGSHALAFYAVDRAGLAEAAQTVSFKIDRTPPGVTVSVTPSTIKNNNKTVPVTVKITASDLGSQLASVVTTVTDRYGKVVPSSFGTTGGVINLTATKGQVYTVTTAATDLAGNSAQSSAKVTVQ